VILLDSNIIIDARDRKSRFQAWAEDILAQALATEGVALSAVVLAELCVGHGDPKSIEGELKAKGVDILDVPAAASAICGRAYSRYRAARRKSGGGRGPSTPLPDFFIGAHAELMGWKLATRDSERFRLYFPNVELIEPQSWNAETLKRWNPEKLKSDFCLPRRLLGKNVPENRKMEDGSWEIGTDFFAHWIIPNLSSSI
jgi:predicted nucleic acid-binding protein